MCYNVIERSTSLYTYAYIAELAATIGRAKRRVSMTQPPVEEVLPYIK